MNDRLQNNIYKCFSVQACENEWVRVSQGKLIVFSIQCLMLKKKKKKKTKLKSRLLPPAVWFHILSCTVWRLPAEPQCHLAPSVFHRHFSVSPTKSESIVYWTQAYVLCHSKGRNPKLWPTQKHTVEDKGWRRPSSTPSPLSSHSSDPFFECIVTKHGNASMSKKCFEISNSSWVFAKSYMPLCNVCILCVM